jgi:hypothetical protein
MKKREDEEAEVRLTADQRAEYERLLEESGRQTAVQQQQLQSLERQSLPSWRFQFPSLF